MSIHRTLATAWMVTACLWPALSRGEQRIDGRLGMGPYFATLTRGPATLSESTGMHYDVFAAYLGYSNNSALMGGIGTRLGWATEWARDSGWGTQVALHGILGARLARNRTVEVMLFTAVGPSLQWYRKMSSIGLAWEFTRVQVSIRASRDTRVTFSTGAVFYGHRHSYPLDAYSSELALLAGFGLSYKL